jgi:hypothetical protein
VLKAYTIGYKDGIRPAALPAHLILDHVAFDLGGLADVLL